ncbi:MAG: hypothetical protein BroJett040_05380 [Oligoflexia bacterium]|nr:MAG: hypothetical protein BroJett040_05380 [Oligoflexia bacterium]
MNTTVMTQNELIEKYGTEPKTLGELFKLIEMDLQSSGEVICQFRVNGMRLSQEDEVRMSSFDRDQIDVLEIQSQKPTDLLFELLDNWSLELPKLIESTDQLAGGIRFEGMEGHLKSFVEMIDSCQFLVESLVSLEGVIKTDYVQSKEWRENALLTSRAIGDALKAFEKKDFVLIAEILEYDLGHSLQIWKELLDGLSQSLKKENERNSKEFSEGIFKKNDSGT